MNQLDSLTEVDGINEVDETDWTAILQWVFAVDLLCDNIYRNA